MTCSFAELPSRDQVFANTQEATESGIGEPDTWWCKVQLSRAVRGLFPLTSAPS